MTKLTIELTPQRAELLERMALGALRGEKLRDSARSPIRC